MQVLARQIAARFSGLGDSEQAVLRGLEAAGVRCAYLYRRPGVRGTELTCIYRVDDGPLLRSVFAVARALNLKDDTKHPAVEALAAQLRSRYTGPALDAMAGMDAEQVMAHLQQHHGVRTVRLDAGVQGPRLRLSVKGVGNAMSVRALARHMGLTGGNASSGEHADETRGGPRLGPDAAAEGMQWLAAQLADSYSGMGSDPETVMRGLEAAGVRCTSRWYVKQGGKSVPQYRFRIAGGPLLPLHMVAGVLNLKDLRESAAAEALAAQLRSRYTGPALDAMAGMDAGQALAHLRQHHGVRAVRLARAGRGTVLRLSVEGGGPNEPTHTLAQQMGLIPAVARRGRPPKPLDHSLQAEALQVLARQIAGGSDGLAADADAVLRGLEAAGVQCVGRKRVRRGGQEGVCRYVFHVHTRLGGSGVEGKQ